MSANTIPITITGVEIKYLKSHPDNRGFFREIIRSTDPIFQQAPPEANSPFMQWSHSKMQRNTVKAWHYHHKQIDWWYVGFGVFDVYLIDNREESPTYKMIMNFQMGDLEANAHEVVVKIPQGVLHGGKVTSDFAHLFYITSQTYDPQDEGRIAYDSEQIAVNWGNKDELIVAANDQKDFEPKYERKRLR